MSDAACPCDVFVHPIAIVNPPGREALAYRLGDYRAFREALLRSLPGELELTHWRPAADGDLALQMLEWWAYLADILTFYNERAANEAYLRTALLPESVQRLVRLIGYRPRPGIGATAVVAARLSASKSVTIPVGFQIQSKPGPGQSPQVFEVDEATTIALPDALSVDPPASPLLVDRGGVLLRGSVNIVKKGDKLLLYRAAGSSLAVTAKSVLPEKDAHGAVNTRVTFAESLQSLAGALASDYRLLKSYRSARPWQAPASVAIIDDRTVVMDSLTRDLTPGDLVMLEAPPAADGGLLVSADLGSPSAIAFRLVDVGDAIFHPSTLRDVRQVSGYAEGIGYVNGKGNNPNLPPDAGIVPVTVFRSVITVSAAFSQAWDAARNRTVVRFDWRDAGELLGTPADSFLGAPAELIGSTAPLQAGESFPVQVAGADGTGIAATAVASAPSRLSLTDLPEQPFSLPAPLEALFGLVRVSRGQTVKREVVGSGNASLVAQDFALQKAPLTYLLARTSRSGTNYESTLQIWVNGIEWAEQSSFFGQAPDARVFVTREDSEHKTHVVFGDGVNGARLPTGTNNVVARYRFGSGADAPPAGALMVVTQPLPGLKEIRNPVAAGGGADPDPPAQIRRYAPRSVLSFGRAVSRDDYETIAAQAPGVARARAYWSFDPGEQRALVVIYVGDDASAVGAAKLALAGAGDPNRPITVKQATAVAVRLGLALRLDPAREAASVSAAVEAALAEPMSGLFGTDNVRIGEPIFHSRIYEVCLAVPGVLAVHALRFETDPIGSSEFQADPGFRHDPGEGRFFRLDRQSDLSISLEGAQDGA